MDKHAPHLLFVVLTIQCMLSGQQTGKLRSGPEESLAKLPGIVRELPDTVAEETILKWMSERDPELRHETIKAIGDRELSDALVAQLVLLTTYEEAETRRLAINALAGKSIRGTAEINAVLHSLADVDESVRVAAASAARKIVPSIRCAASQLSDALKDRDEAVKFAAVQAVRELKCDSSTAVPELSRLAENAARKTRLESIKTLGDLNGDAAPARDVLLRLARHDPDAEIRRAAIISIQSTGPADAVALKDFTAIVRDPVPNVREGAAYTLAIWGMDTDAAQDLLLSLQRDQDEAIRYAVAFGIRYRPPSEKTFLSAANALQDTSNAVRYAAAVSLFKLSSPNKDNKTSDQIDADDDFLIPGERVDWPAELVSAFLRAFSDADWDTRKNLVDAIAGFRISNDRLSARIAELAASDPDESVRSRAANALPALGLNSSSLSGLLAASRDKYAFIREVAIERLGGISPSHWPFDEPYENQEAINQIEMALSKSLSDSSPEVRIASAKSTGSLLSKLTQVQFSPASTLLVALRAALSDRDPDVRNAAVGSLANFRDLSPTDLQHLLKTLNDSNLDVQRATAMALGQIRFPIDTIRQALGLQAITPYDLTTPEHAKKETKAYLKTVGENCAAIDSLMARILKPDAVSVSSEVFNALGWVTSNLNRIVRALEDGDLLGDAELTDVATTAINYIGPYVAKASGFIAERLESRDADIRAAAAKWVGEIPVASPKASQLLIGLLKDQNATVRQSAATALAGVVRSNTDKDRSATVQGLLGAITDPVEDVRRAAVRSAIAIKATDVLRAAFDNPRPDVRTSALNGLSELKVPLRLTLDLLDRAFKDPSRDVRLAALSDLATRGLEGNGLVDRVLPLLEDTSSGVRAKAAEVLGYYRSAAKPAIPKLERLLENDNPGVREAAITTLGWIGPDASHSIPSLISLISDEKLAEIVTKALRRIGLMAIVPLQTASQDAKSEELRARMAHTLTELRRNVITTTLDLTLRNGTKQALYVDERTAVIAVATWCPYSKRLRDFLERDSVRPYFRNITLYFLLEDEAEEVRAHLMAEIKEHPEINSARANGVLGAAVSKTRRAGFFDSSFLMALPGRSVQVRDLRSIGVGSLPAVMSTESSANSPAGAQSTSWFGISEWVNSNWFSDHIHLPDDLRSELQSISGQSLT